MQRAAGAEGAWESKVDSATKVGAKNWVLEARIPLETLGVEGSPAGQEWGWELQSTYRVWSRYLDRLEHNRAFVSHAKSFRQDYFWGSGHSR